MKQGPGFGQLLCPTFKSKLKFKALHSNYAPFVSLSSRQVQDGGGQDPDSADLQAEHALHRKEVVQDQPEVLLFHRHRSSGKDLCC